MIKRRRRFKQQLTLQDRLTAWANKIREHADRLQPGQEREELLKKARQADVASHLNDWANSSGLRSPK